VWETPARLHETASPTPAAGGSPGLLSGSGWTPAGFLWGFCL